MQFNKIRNIIIFTAALIFAGCASTKSIPMTINSDPLGAQVLYKIKGKKYQESEWIYLGNTPLSTQRRLSTEYLNNAHTITIRVMKDGFIDQSKEWSGSQIRKLTNNGERVFWNSVMINGN